MDALGKCSLVGNTLALPAFGQNGMGRTPTEVGHLANLPLSQRNACTLTLLKLRTSGSLIPLPNSSLKCRQGHLAPVLPEPDAAYRDDS